ncbi:hypothetical protein HDC90_001107 [Pedobacter sp. AK013]|uniref:hypothetical protein n=1 Tax=Pedobacter sp. AK013 TaxID=2723071 RepID=UPI00161178CA|nr:hypothetical protein [Pedobacter sp. AK013]MBB6236495.1 hypothetical protein [Pedobacter sp. AK013]
MQGRLLQAARRDLNKIVSSGGFEDDIILSTPDGTITVEVKGLTTGITERYDNEGNKVNSSKTHVSIPEETLLLLAYPVRSVKSGKVALLDHKVKVNDSNGNTQSFVITETNPNATTGLIICFLGRSETE